MARPHIKAGHRITSSESRQARLNALKAAGGWAGRVELSADAYAALQRLQCGRSISATLEALLLERPGRFGAVRAGRLDAVVFQFDAHDKFPGR